MHNCIFLNILCVRIYVRRSPFQIPLYPTIALGMGSLMTAASIAMLVDMRRRYRVRDLQGQIQTKLEGLTYTSIKTTPHTS